MFRYALNSAEKHDAKIYVLHALQPVGVRGFGSPVVNTESIIEKIKKRIERLAE
jgi:hypothetical protein